VIQGGEGAVDSFLCVCVFVFQGGEGAVDAGNLGITHNSSSKIIIIIITIITIIKIMCDTLVFL
jgi:hypothetical protein